jgi:hypothetical protein
MAKRKAARSMPRKSKKAAAGAGRRKRKVGAGSRTAVPGQLYSFNRYIRDSDQEQLTIQIGTSATGKGYAFKLSQIQGYTEFTSLFEYYRIVSMDFHVHLITNPDAYAFQGVPTQANGANWFPRLWYRHDYNDTTTPTVNDMKEHDAKFRVMKPNEIWKISCKPATLNRVVQNDTVSVQTPVWNQWLSTVDPEVPHYGMKFVLDAYNGLNMPASNYCFCRIDVRFHIQCKGLR